MTNVPDLLSEIAQCRICAAALPLGPRNTYWLQGNAWFEDEVIPELRRRVAACLAETPA